MSSRRLWGKPLYAADWENLDYAEQAASWWELFVDLVLVVTCSSVAEKFQEDMIEGEGGLLPFLVTYTIFFCGWIMYTSFSSRFIDNSLLHSVQLFIYLMATCYMVTHTSGFELSQHFAWSAIVQRCSILFMYFTLGLQVPRARSYCFMITLTVLGSILLLGGAAFVADEAHSALFLGLDALWESIVMYLLIFPVVRGAWFKVDLVPLNIDHNSERMGCCIMVVLGESVVSVLINYHRINPESAPTYLQSMALSMCLTFAFALIYFALQPPRELHALRRHGLTGIGFIISHLFISVSLLALGVGVKLAMHTILKPEIGQVLGAGDTDGPRMAPEHAFLLFAATTATLFSIFGMRLLHYGGREPKPTDPPLVRHIKYGWWCMFMVTAATPLAFGWHIRSSETGLSPIYALELLVAIVLSFALCEHVIMHVLSDMGVIEASTHGVMEASRPPHHSREPAEGEPDSDGCSATQPLLPEPALIN